MICRFSIFDNFWYREGAYRDWVGVYLDKIMDPLYPKHWVYCFSCYKMNDADNSPFVAEFPCLSPGRYRFGYYSVKRNALQGITSPLVVV